MGELRDQIVKESRNVKDARGRNIVKVIFVAAAMIALVTGVAVVSYLLTIRSSAEDGVDLAQRVQVACATGSPDADLMQFCPQADKVVDSAPASVKNSTIKGDPGPAGVQGDTGEAGPAPTASQVLVAVRQFCASSLGRCRGGDGENATQAQVALAVAQYCDGRGQCRGNAGSNGTNGADGEDGDDAPAPTTDQIIAAVASFCSTRNDCAGRDGTDGTNGADSTVPGPAGPPGVVSVVDGCDAAGEGQVIANVDATYNADSQTVTLTCSYKDDQTLIPNNADTP